MDEENDKLKYRCDLHNFTKRDFLKDNKSKDFNFLTIHTIKKNRYSKIKQDIYNKEKIIIPLSTYMIPFIPRYDCNITQSVAYCCEKNNKEILEIFKQDWVKVLIHITRYGNFNNIKIIKNLNLKYETQECFEEILNKINY
ncbi:MAG: hypothetical protein ACRC4M_06010 [Mycoplasma sp.]